MGLKNTNSFIVMISALYFHKSSAEAGQAFRFLLLSSGCLVAERRWVHTGHFILAWVLKEKGLNIPASSRACDGSPTKHSDSRWTWQAGQKTPGRSKHKKQEKRPKTGAYNMYIIGVR